MMNRNIDTIFFDVGATLRYVVEDEEFAAAADRALMELVGAQEPHDVFFEKLTKNWKAYRKWAKDTLLDVSEMELWLQYLLPDCPAERMGRPEECAYLALFLASDLARYITGAAIPVDGALSAGSKNVSTWKHPEILE